jgi:serine protease Do
MHRSPKSWVAVGSAVLVIAVLAVAQFWTPPVKPTMAQPVADPPADGLAVARQLSAAFEYVADVARPAVVSIVASSRGPSGRVPFGDRGLSPLEEFFGRDFFDRFGPRMDPEGPMRRGQGSGVIVSTEGYILTNNHVVEGADEVTVRLHDDREFTAEIVGTDPKTDLAVLRIDAHDLQPARLGDSDALRVGEWVVAAGNPFGLTASVTSGIVSAKGRANVGITDYEDFIQTDAAINPGNSGGPLLDLDGEVVGINTAIVTRTGGAMGIGFAIPINMARSIMESLIADGRVVRGWLGVGIQRLTPDLAASFGYEGRGGVLVTEVNDDTPASRAGMRSGDIVVSFDGKPVESMERFRADVAATRPGRRVEFEVFRDGRRVDLQVEIGELDANVVVARSEEGEALDLGIQARELTPRAARELGLDEGAHGVVITEVRPFSAAARAGLRRGDVIEEVQGDAVTSLEEFRSALARVDDGQGMRLTVSRSGARIFVMMKAVS